MSASFEFANSDLRAVKAATKFARFLLAQETLTPSQILAIARALYALQRLPEATPRVDVEFGAGIERGDSRRKENWNWHVRINHESFSITSGGSVWDETVGGDSVSGYCYEIEAGGYKDQSGDVSSWQHDVEINLNPPFEVYINDDSTLLDLDDDEQ